MDPMTLLVSAIGSLAACIAYLYKQQEKRADMLQKKYDDLLDYQRSDMAKMLAKYATISQDYNRIVKSELPHDSVHDNDTLLKLTPRGTK